MDLLEKYIEELKAELVIDEMNVGEVQRRLPARRHHWAARLIRHKRELNKLLREIDVRANVIAAKLKDESPTRLSWSQTKGAAMQSVEIIKYKQQIEDLELIIEFLEKSEKNLSSIQWDIKNIIAIRQLELL